MATTQNKFSFIGLPLQTRVDIAAQSPQGRRRAIVTPVRPDPVVVQNTTKVWAVPVDTACVVKGVTMVFTTIPVCAGGTSTLQMDYVASDGTTTTNIVAAATILSKTNKVPFTFTLAATNPTSCAAGGSFLFTVVTSNNVVGTADVGGSITIGIENVEDSVISD